MKRILLLSILIVISKLTQGQNVNYNEHISCILYEHCTTCHHDGGIAPFSLMDYGTASAAAYGVMQAVNAGTMPPWPSNTEYNSLAHERLLTQDEIDAITNWVNNGVLEGPGVAPTPPVYSGTEEILNPDLTLTMPQYDISTNGNDVYRCFVIPTAIGQDVYISEIEVIPGNYEAVHHVLLFQDETNTPQQLDDADPGPGYTSFGGTGSSASKAIGGWVPGQSKKVYPNGMGVKIPDGASVIMQVHYPTTANGQTDQTKVNIKYTTGFTREIFIDPPINHFDLNEGQLVIPANEVRTFTGDYTIPNQYDIILLDVSPHMHLLGKSIKSYGVTPTNDTIPFIEIEDWDFHWQGFYDFRQPVVFPAGSTFHGEATYDNTSNNPNNPNNPPQTVTAGEATTEEMMLVFFSYTLYLPGDENIVIDTVTVHDSHMCQPLLVGVDENKSEEIDIYPNPTNGLINFNWNASGKASVHINDVYGRSVRTLNWNNSSSIDISDLPNGMYLFELWDDGVLTSSQRIVLQN